MGGVWIAGSAKNVGGAESLGTQCGAWAGLHCSDAVSPGGGGRPWRHRRLRGAP